ncbi:unnamed protein product [Orchesella dallaii]|uniref:Uncharacterized protein n=1 Tax=Orchesella dallaii TaxID=48710 RepID=A0ABP1RCF4_9HEXA
MTAGNVRKLGRPKQFRALKKGQESKENRGVFRDDEVYPDSQVPSQDCFVDENLVMKVRRRGKNKKKVVDTPEDQDDEKQDKFFHYRRPNYTPEENKLLYGDRRFVIDVKDIDKDPSNIHIWQILEPLCCLLRYFPCKFGYQQFFISSHQRWYFFEEEFRNEEFYDRFQPIVTNVASTEIKFAAGWEMEECVVQYPYVDKSFFNRMTKSISKIHCTEFLRNDITLCIPLMLYQHLNPQSLTKLFIAANDPQSLTPDIMRNIHAWYNLGSYIDATLTNAANGKCDFNQETIYLLRTFPKMRYSNKTANKEMHCTACTPKFQRTPMVKVVFNTKQELGTPYDPVTLVEHPYPQKPRNDAKHWCRNCSLAAKKFHRLAHFRYSFSRIMRHNIAKDVQAMRERGVTVTDNSLLRISDIDVNWRYTLFLDLQLSIAEVMAEFYHDQHKP